MSVETPVERAYYYECSAGKFRLTLFIPPQILKEMVGPVSNLDGEEDPLDVEEDFPDGVDLGCTEADFQDFARTYRIRLEHHPDQLRAAFLAMFSSTKDWDSFRGTGFVRADDLERMAKEVHQQRERAALIRRVPRSAPTSFDARREWAQSKAKLESKVTEWLKETSVEDVDPNVNIQQQSFSDVKMEGRSAKDVFFHLQRRREDESS